VRAASSAPDVNVVRMADFLRADLRGSRFERVDLSGAELRTVDLAGARFRAVDLSGAVMRGVELVDVDIHGEIQNVTINGVDIGPLVNAELDGRYPGCTADTHARDACGTRASRAPRPVPCPREHRLYAERDLDALVARSS